MPGKLYLNDIRLSRAYSEGFESPNGATNPHPSGTPEADAWEEGYFQCDGGTLCDYGDDCYKGNAANTGDHWCKENGI